MVPKCTAFFPKIKSLSIWAITWKKKRGWKFNHLINFPPAELAETSWKLWFLRSWNKSPLMYDDNAKCGEAKILGGSSYNTVFSEAKLRVSI